MTQQVINKNSSKPLLLYVLEILRADAKPEKPMTAVAVQNRMKERYGIILDKRTVRHYLKLLKDDPLTHVFCDCRTLTQKSGATTDRKTNWYYKSDPLFDRFELVFLAEGIASSQKVPAKYKEDLIEKLKGLSDGKGLTALQRAKSSDEDTTDNREFFLNIELIDEAMSEDKCLSFHLGEHNLKGKLSYPPEEEPYLVDPEFIFVHNGRYYLQATLHGKDIRLSFRIDMILKMEIALDNKGKPIVPNVKAYDDSENKENAQEYRNLHLFGNSKEESRAKLKVLNTAKNKYQLFDQFGEDLKLSICGEDRNFLFATVHANKVALKTWVMGHADDVEVIEPPELRKELHDNAVALAEKYKIKEDAQ